MNLLNAAVSLQCVLVMPGSSDRHKQASPLLCFFNLLLSCPVFPSPLAALWKQVGQKVGSLVYALSTTKGAEQFDPADYLGFFFFLRCTELRGELLLKNSLCLSVIPRKVSFFFFSFPSRPAHYFCSVFTLIQQRLCKSLLSSEHPPEG